ncbi:MAG TPA: hypothetical protein VMJ30_01360 [Gemmatimonadales bacterium]|nr:hypothetical protein [Gemmatimonadales bacterium]
MIAAAVVVLPAPTASAQGGTRPQLGGHTFVPTDQVPDAFVRTFVRCSLGRADAEQISYPVDITGGDTLIALTGTLSYVLLDFEYQFAVRDWIAAHVGLDMRTRAGTQLSSLLAEGLTVSDASDFGWLARIFQTHKLSLCGDMSVMKLSYTLIDVEQFAEDIANGVPDPSLIDDVPAVRGAGALRFAWAASDKIGVTMLAEESYGDSPWRQKPDSWEHALGASLDLDGLAAWHIPLGVAFAFRQTSLPLLTSESAPNAYSTVLRLAYNGRPDFLFALDLLGATDRETQRRRPLTVGGASVSLRCYF